MGEDNMIPWSNLIKEQEKKEDNPNPSGWDDPEIKSKRFDRNPPEGSICLVSVDFSEEPQKDPRNIRKAYGMPVKHIYWFLESATFYCIWIDNKIEEFGVEENVVWQFPKGVAQVLGPIFRANSKKGFGCVLVYRKTQRTAMARKLEDTEVNECLNMSREALIDKYFSEFRI